MGIGWVLSPLGQNSAGVGVMLTALVSNNLRRPGYNGGWALRLLCLRSRGCTCRSRCGLASASAALGSEEGEDSGELREGGGGTLGEGEGELGRGGEQEGELFH